MFERRATSIIGAQPFTRSVAALSSAVPQPTEIRMPFALELALDPSTLAILFTVAFTAGFIDAIAVAAGC